MSMTEWAEYEVKLACKKENPDWDGKSFDYGCSCYQSALKAFKSLCEDGHSGFSYSVTRSILKRLLDELPLTPIEDTEENWGMSYKDEDGSEHFQCKRMFSLFKDVKKDGTVLFHDSERCYCQEIDDPNDAYINSMAREIVDELFPITMPYYPKAGRYKVVVKTFSAEGYFHDNEDYNTRCYLNVVTPDNKVISVDRCFAEVKGKGMVKISKEEYMERLEHEKGKNNEQKPY